MGSGVKANTEGRAPMSASDFDAALRELGLSRTEAAEVLGASSIGRVSDWARGARKVPPYIAAHVRTLLASIPPPA